MARHIHEIMNSELFALRPDTPAIDALADIVGLGITGAPVIDDDGFPLGLLSLRDLARPKVVEDGSAGSLMTMPAVVVRASATIEQAAQMMADTSLHRLVVVDAEGRAVGVVASVDVIRGLTGRPAVHPLSFPHLDAETGLTWSDPFELSLEAVLEHAPDGPGLFTLTHNRPGVPSARLWVEAAADLSARLIEVVSTEPPEIKWFLHYRHLEVQTAVVADPKRRAETLKALRDPVVRWPRQV